MTATIELARKAIVGLIKIYGEVLKGLVKVIFSAFPEIAKRMTDAIDLAVRKATSAVNKAADLLKKATSAVLGFLAKTIDSLLGLVQNLYSGILTVVGMLINGELQELLKKVGNLIESAKTAPEQFETAALEELLGGNLDQPLSPEELGAAKAANISIPAQGAKDITADSQLPRPPWTSENVGVDAVEHNMQLSPGLIEEAVRRTGGNGTVMPGTSNARVVRWSPFLQSRNRVSNKPVHRQLSVPKIHLTA